jgi:hypothetical protein
MKKDLYLGGEKIEEKMLLPDDFKDFFVNFIRYLFGRGKAK